jgi:hypothetical protein
MNNEKKSAKALIPMLVFVLLYLSTGFILQIAGEDMAFYQLPAPVAVFVGIIVAFIIFKGSIEEKTNTFIEGCGDSNIIIMCLIYLLAGAFSTLAKASGGVESVVGIGLNIIPIRFLTAGVFLIASFLSLAIGSSVGAITALGPISIGLATSSGINPSMMLGALVGGSMFGDNLSIISDTTIAASRTQDIDLKDKFKVNFKIAFPSAIITFFIFLFFARPDSNPQIKDITYNMLDILPYIFVLVAALCGMNVLVVLTGGIFFSAIILLTKTNFDLLNTFKLIWEGFDGMFEIFLLSMLIGGLSHMVEKEGGINWIISKIEKSIKDEKSAEFGIVSLVSIIDIAVANNTVAIIIAGPIAKNICKKYEIDPRRSASLLDTFACIFQGLVPYSAQLLIASGFSNGSVSPFEIIPFLRYQFILLAFAIASIYIPYAKPKD